MAKSNTPKFIKSIRTTLSKHGPEILTGVGVTGVITSTVLAVKATPKALRLIDNEKQYRAELADVSVEEVELPKLDVLKTCWKCYIPAAITGTVGLVCIIGASSANARRHAALATAYKLSETALVEYRDKVVETIGEKKEQAVRDKVAEEQITKTPVSKNEVIITGKGESLCFDPWSSRYFTSNIDLVRRAEVTLNERMLHDITGYASLNEFYDEIGLSHTEVGDYLGWNTTNLIKLEISSHVTDDGRPSLVVGHYNRPEYDYDR